MSKNDDLKTIGQTFLSAGKDLVQNRFKTQLEEYKLQGVEKGSKIAAITIVSIIQIMAIGIFWFFLCFAIGHHLSFKVWGNSLYGFGAVAIFHFIIVLLLLVLGRPIKWIIEAIMLKKLEKK